MKKFIFLLFFVCFSSALLKAQQSLPGITVNNLSGKIIVSWKNDYTLPLATINIQRSFDSLKNYTTIGSVLNPQNTENGYADANPPYNKMYYRVFIAFEGGSYIISNPVRPAKDTNAVSIASTIRYPWQAEPALITPSENNVFPNGDPKLPISPSTAPPTSITTVTPTVTTPATATTAAIIYPSRWVYTAKDNNVIIHLPEADTKKYTAAFFDELENRIFELTNLKEEYLIIEKVNFIRSGWYRFELYNNGKIVEKNKFFIPKDGKISNEPPKKNGNK